MAPTSRCIGLLQGLNFLAGAILLASGPEMQPTADALKVSAQRKAAVVARYRPALALCIVKRLLKLHGFAALYSSKLIPVLPPSEALSRAARAPSSGAAASAAGAGDAVSSSAGSEAVVSAAEGEDIGAGLPQVEETSDDVDGQESEELTAEAVEAAGGRVVSPLQVMSSLFVRMLQLHAPRVMEHLTDSNFLADLLAVKWFTTCFARALRVRGTLMAVDAILAGVPNVLLRLGAGLLLVLERRVLRMTQDDLMTQLEAAVLEADVADAWEQALQLPASLIQGQECGTPAPWESTMFGHHALKGKLERSGKSAHWVTVGKPAALLPTRPEAGAGAAGVARPRPDRSSPQYQERMRRIRRALRRALLKASVVSQFRAVFSSEDVASVVKRLRRGTLYDAAGEAAMPPVKEGVALASAAHRPSAGLVMDALLAMHAGTLPSHEQLRLFADDRGRLIARPSSAAELLPLSSSAANDQSGHENGDDGEAGAGTLVEEAAGPLLSLDERREMAAAAGKPSWAIDACDPRTWAVETVREGEWRRWCEVSLSGVLVEGGVGWYFITVRVPEALYESVTKHRFSHFDKLLQRLRSEGALKTLSSTLEAMRLRWPDDATDFDGDNEVASASRSLFGVPDATNPAARSFGSSPAIAAAAASAASMPASARAFALDAVPAAATGGRHHRPSLSTGGIGDSTSVGADSVLGGLSIATEAVDSLPASEDLPALPPKTWFGHSPVRHSFLTRRGAQLRAMVQRLLDTPFVARHPEVTRFFGLEWEAIRQRATLPTAVRYDLWKCAEWCWSEDLGSMQRALTAIKRDHLLPLRTVSAALRLLQHRIHSSAARPARPRMPTRTKSEAALRRHSRVSSPASAASAGTPVPKASESSDSPLPPIGSDLGFVRQATRLQGAGSATRTPVRRVSTFTDRMVVAGLPSPGKEASKKALVALASPAAAARGTLAK